MKPESLCEDGQRVDAVPPDKNVDFHDPLVEIALFERSGKNAQRLHLRRADAVPADNHVDFQSPLEYLIVLMERSDKNLQKLHPKHSGAPPVVELLTPTTGDSSWPLHCIGS